MSNTDARVKYPASAVILAGGSSRRMEKEKSLLPVHGNPLIQHIYHQLAPYFDQVLISANDKTKYAFLDLPVIPDLAPGCGPLMGIATALGISGQTLNFVTACDIPEINMEFVMYMLEWGRDFDAVIPVTGKELYEPLFAVYNKTILPAMSGFLKEGGRKISELFKQCKIHYIKIKNKQWLFNLNTLNDYQAYLAVKKVPGKDFSVNSGNGLPGV